ncbi:GNAT family N-acetyltransferase [Chelatococcus reniformis]|uniref:GCN5 family N-acetyltransferase n=1 Tax=Chelatococcus reniformis TaxID=1494448 RepID=A0A916U7N3_9HYPH|nr:N-acetyltransferase [Chelatococcus reniformis]GGC63670.1 GCN5 family N-acetyltransferase [Chelatococcus reniformis]
MMSIADETLFEAAAREALLDRAMGADRFGKASERLREDRLPAAGLSLVARESGPAGSRLVGTVRLWHVAAGPARPALLLGPLAVEPGRQGDGIGSGLMREALRRAVASGHAAVLLVGDAPYYERFGFSAAPTAALWMPGPYAPERLLACELVAGALDGARGLISATGARAPMPELAQLVAAAREAEPELARAA